MMNCSLINHNNPVLQALPFIQATAEVILHNLSTQTVKDCLTVKNSKPNGTDLV